MIKDIIITAFACGGKMKCQEEAAKFADPPLVINVPGGSQTGFRNTAQKYRKNNTILDNFLKNYAKDVTPRRICLVSFSAGWSWSTEVLRAPADPARIDTVLVMDGIHTRSLDCWFNYAELCLKTDAKLFLAHTQIKPPFISSTATNTNIINHAREIGTNKDPITIPEYIWDVTLESPISVYSNIENPKTKTYSKDPLDSFEAVGNVARFEYEGGKAQDHIYNAHYTQPRFWNWIRNLWANPDYGVKYS